MATASTAVSGKAIGFDNVSKDFGSGGRAAVRNVSLDVMQGHFVVLLGPSGCGKTTLMKMVNRLYEPTAGKIYVNGTDIHQQSVTELRRQIGYVIQQVGLFPHMRVDKNIAVVPQMLKWDKTRIAARVDELLDLVGLPPDEFKRRYPGQLSGGQQQRVGLARALAADPLIMLMDEPFAAIDNITRSRLQDELIRVQQTVRKTVLFVTHDVEEALKLADEIVVMREGQVVQYDTPLNILSNPANEFVAQLIGSNDILRQLSLQPVASVMSPWNAASNVSDERTVEPTTNLREALGDLMSSQSSQLKVVDSDKNPVGLITLDAIHALASKRTSANANQKAVS